LTVRRAVAEDRDAVVRALVRAFDVDPLPNYLLRADAGRERAFATVFDVAFRRLTLPTNGAWVAEGGAGAALWTPPGEWKTWRALADVPRLAWAVGASRLTRTLVGTRRVERHHPREPHWYLFAIGVDPDHQGRGIGSALLRAVLETCDARGEAAYLEASSHENARLYERHGFRATGEVALSPTGPSVTLMWRAPRSAE
jgi:ribosomal protein S18 acetylase RimI-like enzyme